ncbi:acid phosphatase 1-like [Salvia miltiorrhiza]|uniref:acid phosphatase 1-like n=1 Tax=Salvia miltiorrhiza TaxID=226208 RepID=UPI0025AD6C35|nr:acid phosphatase 1-like [Salvia miltiorrhiza]
MIRLSLLVFVAFTLLSSSHADAEFNPIRQLGRHSVGSDDYKVNCQSFRVGVEANNLRDWITIPSYCKSYIKTYLQKNQYSLDVEAIAFEAVDYAESLQKDVFLKDIWVFDIEETLLSNLGYLASSSVDFGTQQVYATPYYEWLTSNATVVPAILELYNAVVENGFEIVLLSEAPESIGDALVQALQNAGFSGWTKLILKGDADNGKSPEEYKSAKRTELVNLRYRIAGNVGDQWSDLSGENVGIRTFKVPNPVYNRIWD